MRDEGQQAGRQGGGFVVCSACIVILAEAGCPRVVQVDPELSGSASASVLALLMSSPSLGLFAS